MSQCEFNLLIRLSKSESEPLNNTNKMLSFHSCLFWITTYAYKQKQILAGEASVCTLIIHGSVVIHSPLVFPHPTWRTIKLSRVTALLSILCNIKLQLSTSSFFCMLWFWLYSYIRIGYRLLFYHRHLDESRVEITVARNCRQSQEKTWNLNRVCVFDV